MKGGSPQSDILSFYSCTGFFTMMDDKISNGNEGASYIHTNLNAALYFKILKGDVTALDQESPFSDHAPIDNNLLTSDRFDRDGGVRCSTFLNDYLLCIPAAEDLQFIARGKL